MGHTFESQRKKLDGLALEVRDPRASELIALVGQNELRLSGGAKDVLPNLRAMVNGGELFQVHSVLAAAYHDVGDAAAAANELAWLRANRGRAYAEYAGSSALQALNVMDSTKSPAGNACVASSASGR